jgi:uncharacterized membrane protein YhaH (DUF805 family)
MNAFFAILRQLLGLFVDDGSLALALVVWCAAAGLILPRVIPFSEWEGVVLVIGCIAILLTNVTVTVRRHRNLR